MAFQMSAEMQQWEDQVKELFERLTAGFQKLEKMKDPGRQSKTLEDLTAKMRECKRLIKEYDREMKLEEPKNTPEINRMLNEKKQALIKELNSFVALRKTYVNSLGGKEKKELLDGGAGDSGTDNYRKASEMSNQELVQEGRERINETDEAIERSKKVVEDTINIGAQTGVTLKGQTEQLGRIVNELDNVHFSIKKASKLVSEIGRQIATDKCIMLVLALVVFGVIAIIVVKIVDPKNKNIRDIPGINRPSPSPPPGRRLLRYSY